MQYNCFLQIAFAAADSVSGLKLVEAGLPQEQIALMAIPMVPVQIVLPWIIRYMDQLEKSPWKT